MSYRSDRFNESMHSLEMSLGDIDISKAEIFSDRGAGVERMIDAIDFDENEARELERIEDEAREQSLRNAIGALVAAGLGHTAPTLLAIVNNVNNREASICEMKSL